MKRTLCLGKIAGKVVPGMDPIEGFQERGCGFETQVEALTEIGCA